MGDARPHPGTQSHLRFFSSSNCWHPECQGGKLGAEERPLFTWRQRLRLGSHSSAALEHLRSLGTCSTLPKALLPCLAICTSVMVGKLQGRSTMDKQKGLAAMTPGRLLIRPGCREEFTDVLSQGSGEMWYVASRPQNQSVEGVTQMVIGHLLTYKEPVSSGGDSLLIGTSWFGTSGEASLSRGSRAKCKTPLGGPS